MLGLCMLPQALQLSVCKNKQNWDQVMNKTNCIFEYTTFPKFLVRRSFSRSDLVKWNNRVPVADIRQNFFTKEINLLMKTTNNKITVELFSSEYLLVGLVIVGMFPF